MYYWISSPQQSIYRNPFIRSRDVRVHGAWLRGFSSSNKEIHHTSQNAHQNYLACNQVDSGRVLPRTSLQTMPLALPKCSQPIHELSFLSIPGRLMQGCTMLAIVAWLLVTFKLQNFSYRGDSNTPSFEGKINWALATMFVLQLE